MAAKCLEEGVTFPNLCKGTSCAGGGAGVLADVPVPSDLATLREASVKTPVPLITS